MSRLTQHTRELLNELGSSLVQNLQFRDVWYFVGQKAIHGFTTHEKVAVWDFRHIFLVLRDHEMYMFVDYI